MNRREQAEHWLERVLLALLIGTLIFTVLATGAARSQDLAIAQTISGLALVVWVLMLWTARPGRVFVPPVCWGIAVFCLYAAAWYPHALLEYVARREVIYVAYLATVFWIATLILRKTEFTRPFVYFLVAVAALVAGYGLYQFVTGSEHVWHFIRPAQYAGRASGTFICPNHFAAFLGMVFPLALGQAFLGRCHLATRLFLGYAALVLLAGITVSLSRGAWLASGLTLLFLMFVLLRRRGARWLAVALLLLIAIGVYLFVQRVPKVRDRLSYERSANTSNEMRTRLWIWQSSWAMWRDQPWIGVGPGHLDYRFPAYRVRLAQYRPGRAHNDYLNLLVDWGVVGAAIGMGTLALLAWSGVASWRRLRRPGANAGLGQSDRAGLLLGAGGGLVYAAAHSVVDFNLFVPGTAGVAAALAGALVSHARFATTRHWLSLRLPVRGLISAAALVVAALLGVQSYRTYREARWLDAASLSAARPTQRLDPLKKAHTIEPANPDTLYEIGECFRLLAWQGDTGWEDATREALTWYRSADVLNSHSAYPPLRIGMCLDWLGHPDAARRWFEEALRRDPLNFYVVALRGWHEFQEGNFIEARSWFQRSLEIKIWPNPISTGYLRIIQEKLKLNAAGAPTAQ